MVILHKLMIRHMEKVCNEYSLETLPILVEHLQKMLTKTKVLELHGEMGAGKTTLIIELLKIMGVNDPEGSPTYKLMNTCSKTVPKFTTSMRFVSILLKRPMN